jgi:hypothetical protein
VSRVPDFFIVGHPKSGTTALYEMLRRHPRIFMPDLKEPRYFASDLPSRYNPPRPGMVAETYDDYLALFDAATADQIAGEASPVYIWSRTAAQNIARVRPDARIVAILREPASYLRSLHFELIEARIEKEPDLRRAIELEPQRIGPKPDAEEDWPEVLQYTDHVRYVEQLRRFDALFPPEQMLVIIYDDFRADNAATVRRVLQFIGVDEDSPIEVTEANPTVRLRSVRMDEMVSAVDMGRTPAARVVKSTVKTLAPPPVRRRMRGMVRGVLFGAPKPADEELMLELRHRFKPEVEALGDYLGRDLVAQWGYRGIA